MLATNRNVKLPGARMVLLAILMLLGHSGHAIAQGDNGHYVWPAYSPTVAYDYIEEFGPINPPTQVLNDVSGVVGTYSDGWWCFRWGANKNSLVTSASWIPLIARLNKDFAYITDIMRWPRDVRVRNGYYSTVYLYGSGISTDNASNTALGGWQGTTNYLGQAWPMILASYYPVYSYDPATTNSDAAYQTGAMVHEGIHCILSSMPGCKNAGWFQECGNTWLQGTMDSQRSGDFSAIGWLSAGGAIAPFMPIECYSGWLQDDTFGGPSAEGVNITSGSQQLCTWRNLLGGTQYGECFPHAMEVILGPRSVAWVWRNATVSGRVLQDLAEAPGGLGPAQTRRLIQEYRARQAFCDFGSWSYAFKKLLDNNWNANIHPENAPVWINAPVWNATCYVATTQVGNDLTPETRTLPGWSGANQIPLLVSAGATTATVTFNPIGANMSCQLVYRDTSGNVHYGTPVSSGVCSIGLSNVRNNAVVAVICNTDYAYLGETTRKAKFNYTLTLGAGITGKANIYTKWYDYTAPNYTVTASAGANGTISPAGAISVAAGANRAFTITPAAGYAVSSIAIDGVHIGTMTNYSFTNVRGAHSISATFAHPSFSVYASAAKSGTIFPAGDVAVTPGANQTFTITPNAGYEVQDVSLDGVSVGAVTSYTINNVQAKHIVLAKFKGSPTAVPHGSDLLFACITDSFPASGSTGNWDTFLPGGTALSTMNSPAVEMVDNVKWEKNTRTESDGYFFGHYDVAIPVNGASIVVAVKPKRNATSSAWTSVVDAFYNNLMLGLNNQTGQIQVWRKGGAIFNTGVIIPDGQKTILSLVVQPTGAFKVFANGVQVYNQTATSAFSSLSPGAQTYMHDINVGRNSPDTWTTFNGNIGDVYFYKIALSDSDRQTLETKLTNKFINGIVTYNVTATAGSGGTISPAGALAINSGTSQAYTIIANSGYMIANVVVDGVSMGAVTSYSFNNVTANHTIAATFVARAQSAVAAPLFENYR